PKGVRADVDNILVTSGGLEGMNLLCQLFIDPGDVILVESPTFVHCVEIFEMFQARCVSVEMDEDGMVPEDLEDKIRKHSPKMVYVIPTFQNPTGRTLSLERRKKIAGAGGAMPSARMATPAALLAHACGCCGAKRICQP
ncbi:MAG: aminotransferase class I/II-fold pyridoxal phosphate-dependent enzyme, partial [Deltaproteobacteria bacterium]|nr:aminotransferase class I/II-fold pyridoxal phosphate-dependent enzyme [Deltaproteobacteria bacterium]